MEIFIIVVIALLIGFTSNLEQLELREGVTYEIIASEFYSGVSEVIYMPVIALIFATFLVFTYLARSKGFSYIQLLKHYRNIIEGLMIIIVGSVVIYEVISILFLQNLFMPGGLEAKIIYLVIMMLMFIGAGIAIVSTRRRVVKQMKNEDIK